MFWVQELDGIHPTAKAVGFLPRVSIKPEELIKVAREVKINANQPYSNYSVGVALPTEGENVFRGVNIENVTYDMCSHAERTAIKSATTNGKRSFECLAISTESEDGAPPLWDLSAVSDRIL